MAIELTPLWDFARPELSEQRFREALTSATGDDALILQTQIARSYGLRKDFAQARAILAALEPQLAAAGAEPRVRYQLELGRSYASATHAEAAKTPEDTELARAAYQRALLMAKENQLDGLAIDAIHMLAFVDTTPADQLKWGQEALAVVEASDQAAAKAWEASIRNNIGLALHQLGRLTEALEQFELAVRLREQGSDPGRLRIAHWMVAWTLRGLGRLDEALARQHQLERECAAADAPDPYVFEELELLYVARGDQAMGQHYAELRRQASR